MRLRKNRMRLSQHAGLGKPNAGDSNVRSIAQRCPRISGLHRKRNRSAGGNDFHGSRSGADDFGARLHKRVGTEELEEPPKTLVSYQGIAFAMPYISGIRCPLRGWTSQ